jgi:hypothetical protein
MACPICDQKPMNCDCTETEKRQWSEIEDLRLTDEEREAILTAADLLIGSKPGATLRNLLERLHT